MFVQYLTKYTLSASFPFSVGKQRKERKDFLTSTRLKRLERRLAMSMFHCLVSAVILNIQV